MLVCFLLLHTTHGALADETRYRTIEEPPSAPEAPDQDDPPEHPEEPCIPVIDGAFVGLNCNPGFDWATISMNAWYTNEQIKTLAWSNDTQAWASGDLPQWNTETQGQLATQDHSFSSSNNTALVHVHDDLEGDLHGEITFVVKGGPQGAKWVCKHQCIIPDNGFFVSINYLELSPIDHLSQFPTIPATSGTILVTFS